MSDEDESDEVWIRDGEAWTPDGKALLRRYGGLYLYRTEEGAMFMGIPGRGEISVDSLLLEERATDVPPDRSGTVVSINPRKPA